MADMGFLSCSKGPCRLVFVTVLCCMLAVPLVAEADPRATVAVTVIHAKKGQPYLHDGLKPLWDTLKKTFGDKFTHYNLLSKKQRQVAKYGKVRLKIPDGERFAVIYKGVTPKKGLLRVALEYGDFRTKVRIHDGGLFFQAGKKYRGGVLLVAITATLIEE